MEKKEEERATPAGQGAITPLDIQQKEFRIARVRGYKERDVDEFLDRLTEDLSELLAENEKLRLQVGAGAMIGAPDLEDVSRQADEIIQRARDEAARIVADAEATAKASPAGSSTDDPATVTAFLHKEREFLRSLAQLVQEHAEGVKDMAREVFARPTDSVSQPPAPEDTASVAAPPPRAPETELATAHAVTRTEAEEPIRLDEPEPATVGAPEADEDTQGDRSLRELFWGEE